jgi:hypothetical protein
MAVAPRYEVGNVPERAVESPASAVEWGAIAGGALAAIGISIIVFTLGSGFGLAAVRPWSFSNAASTTFGVGVAIGLIVTQWLASALGGYLTGCLRTKWVGIRTEEVFFRDMAHGFLAWALATLLMAALFSVVGSATVAPMTGGAAVAVTAEAADQARKAAASFSLFTSISFLIGAFISERGRRPRGLPSRRVKEGSPFALLSSGVLAHRGS